MKARTASPASKGFTLIELMIAMVVGLLVSGAAVSAFLAHTRTVYQQMSYNRASEDVNEAYAILSRLIIQARRDSIVVATTEADGKLTASHH